MQDEMIDIVNENDQVTSTMLRTVAHEGTRLHRVVNAWFFNSKGEVLLQRRAKMKSNLAGLLDYTVGGHVPSGKEYEDALLMETQEETGVRANITDYVPLEFYMPNQNIKVPDIAMHARKIYAYEYNGTISELRFDPEELEGFEWRKIEDLLHEVVREPKKFVPIFSHEYGMMLKTMKQIESLARAGS